MNSELKEARLKNKFTQKQAADFLGISLRSYKSYENEEDKVTSIKYKYLLNELKENSEISETKGIISQEEIRQIVNRVLKDYKVEYCYLFGSYAKNKATEKSDIDLLISCDVKGIKFYGLTEKLREALHKNIDLLNVNQLSNNTDLTNEILKDGIKIYG